MSSQESIVTTGRSIKQPGWIAVFVNGHEVYQSCLSDGVYRLEEEIKTALGIGVSDDEFDPAPPPEGDAE